MSRAGRGRDRFGPSLLKSAWEASRCFGAKRTRRDRPDAWSEALPCLTAIAVLRRESGRDGSWIQVCEKWFPAQSEGSSFAADHGWFGFSATIPLDGSFRENCKDKLADWVAAWLREETCEFEPVVREVLHISVLAFPILDDTESCRPEHLHLPVVSV